jgi:hypothetical protein
MSEYRTTGHTLDRLAASSGAQVAFARLGYAEEVCIDAICSAAALQDQAFGRREAFGEKFFSFQPLSMSMLGSFSETRTLNTIAGTLWSLGRLNARPPQLLALLTARIEQLLPGTTVKEVGTAMTALWRLQHKPKSPSLLPALMKRALVSGPDLCVLHERPFLSCARPVQKTSTVSSSVTTCCSSLLFSTGRRAPHVCADTGQCVGGIGAATSRASDTAARVRNRSGVLSAGPHRW